MFFVLQPYKARHRQLQELPQPHSPDFQKPSHKIPLLQSLLQLLSCIQPQYTKQFQLLLSFCLQVKKGPKDLCLFQGLFVSGVCEHSPTSTIFPVMFCFKFYCHILNWILNWPVQYLALHIQTTDLLKKNETLRSRKKERLKFIYKSSLKANN